MDILGSNSNKYTNFQTQANFFQFHFKLEILQSLGGLYDGVAFYPSTGLRRTQFRSLSLLPESSPPH